MMPSTRSRRSVAEEGIDCYFRRSGKLKLASKPAHFDALARNFEAIHAEVDPDTALLRPQELSGEIGSRSFHGAMLSKKSAMMHMGRFVTGLAQAAAQHGASIFEDAPVTDRQRVGVRHALITPRGTVTADAVLLATGAYTSKPFDYFRRRIVPVGSFIIATRPLTPEEVAATVPGNRTFVTSLNIGNYFRLAPDRRLIFGGRARFSAISDQRSDAKSGEILRASMAGIFPASCRRGDRLLLGWARRHDQRSFPAGGRSRRRSFRHGLLRSWGTDVDPHGRGDGGHSAWSGRPQPNGCARLAGDSGTSRASPGFCRWWGCTTSCSTAYNSSRGVRVAPAHPGSRLGQPPDVERLQLHILLNANLRALASETGWLDAAKRRNLR